ncbi:MAG: hypothetical protein D6731_26230 [Planctomycetota bacterium]|nr:MAG: hypothetical protein D6731_26230 [Planctomycetota bacterium]
MAVLGACWALPGPAGAQEPSLRKLEEARNRALAAHHDAIVRVRLLEQQLARRRAALRMQTERVRRLQAEPAGVLRNAQLQAARREQNHAAAEVAGVEVRLREARDTQRVRRLELVRASWAWVARLLETAGRAWRIGRKKQAREHTDRALAELERLEALESIEDPPEEEFRPRPVDPDAPTPVLRDLVELYAALEDGARERARSLAPVEEKLRTRVAHLDRLVRYAYAVPTLAERLRRARRDLERVSGLRRGAEERARRYAGSREEIERVLSARALRLEGLDRSRRP